MAEQPKGLQRLGRYSGVAVVLSIAACYGTLALVAILSLAGVVLSIHEGAWAGVIVVLVWIAVIAMGINIHRYQNFGPFILSDIGALLVSWAMLVNYSPTMEGAGFAMMLTAAFWDRHLKRKVPEVLPGSEQGTG
jgi:arsenite methyltransferase